MAASLGSLQQELGKLLKQLTVSGDGSGLKLTAGCQWRRVCSLLRELRVAPSPKLSKEVLCDAYLDVLTWQDIVTAHARVATKSPESFSAHTDELRETVRKNILQIRDRITNTTPGPIAAKRQAKGARTKRRRTQAPL